MFCRRYIKKIFSLVSVENHSKFSFPKMFFMRSLFRFPKLPYTLDFHVFLLVSQKSVMGNKASSLSTNRARSSFFKAFFLKLFFFLIRFCSFSGIMVWIIKKKTIGFFFIPFFKVKNRFFSKFFKISGDASYKVWTGLGVFFRP